MKNYSKCLNCNSTSIMPDLGVMDAGAYPSGSHKVSDDKSLTDRLLSDVSGGKKGHKGGSSIIRAHVCLDCGYTAIFAQDLKKMART